LRADILEYENIRHGTSYAMSNISITAGGTYALNRVFEMLFHFVDTTRKELLIVAPNYYRMLERAKEHANVVNIVTQSENKFLPTLEEIKQGISSDTLAIFMCNPTNPGYNYLPKEQMKELIKFIEEKKIYLILDEAGDNFFHSGLYRYPKEIQSKYVIRTCSSSKGYQLAEYRLGYILADADFIGDKAFGFVKLIGDDMGNPPLAANDSWQVLLQGEKNWIKNGRGKPQTDYEIHTHQNEESIKKKKDYTLKMLQSSPYVTHIIEPDSSFNVTFQFTSKRIKTDIEFFSKLLETKSVSVVPCSGFGLKEEECYIRLTFAVHDEMLQEGLTKISEFLKEINS
jgi:aspartate/methionine/tyrosine aminotransferase